MILMNIKEIYVLNRALDGKDIYPLPSFKDLNMSEILVTSVKDSLIEQGLLENHESFTMEGVRITKRISDYKKAKKYVRINDMVIGILDDDLGVLLQKSYLDESYIFELISISDSVGQLLKSHPFLQQSVKEQTNQEREMEFDELSKAFVLRPSNMFNVATQDNENKKNVTDELYFSSNDQLYIYDCEKKILYSKSQLEIQEALKERMAV